MADEQQPARRKIVIKRSSSELAASAAGESPKATASPSAYLAAAQATPVAYAQHSPNPRASPGTPTAATAGEEVEVGRRATWEEVQALFVPRYLPFKRRPMPIPEKGKGGRYSKLKQAIKAENFHLLPASQPTYVTLDAPPSIYPAKKYCDFTGLPAKYTEPQTKLRYAHSDTYQIIKALHPQQVQATLALREAAVRMR